MNRFLQLFSISAVLVLSSNARACTIPVFRYALEKWDLTPYEVFVYHEGTLPDDLQKELAKWDTPNRANIEITQLDVRGKLTKEQANLLQRLGKNEKLPWMVVRSKAPDAPAAAWSGACTVAALNALIDSPMRRTLLAHLTRGDSAIYLLLTSKDEKADGDAFAMAAKELRRLEKAIPLPELTDEGPKLTLPLPLKMSLPLLVLDREDAAEAGLIRFLLAVEADLDQVQGPMLFAIYGKGRVLPPLYNHGGITNLNAKMLKAATEFLCGPCSCEVKDLVPGTDLLMAANWSEVFDQMFEGKEVFALPKTSFTALPSRYAPRIEMPAAKEMTPAPVIEAPTEPEETVRPCTRCWLWLGAGGALILVLLSGAWVLASMRK